MVLRPGRNSPNKDFAFVRRAVPKPSVNQPWSGESSVLPNTLDADIADPETQPHGALGRVSLR